MSIFVKFEMFIPMDSYLSVLCPYVIEFDLWSFNKKLVSIVLFYVHTFVTPIDIEVFFVQINQSQTKAWSRVFKFLALYCSMSISRKSELFYVHQWENWIVLSPSFTYPFTKLKCSKSIILHNFTVMLCSKSRVVKNC